MPKFENDDIGYLQWLNKNPNGFVVNSYKKPSASYLMLHRATCPSITGKPANGKWWTKNYSKICSNNIKELENWAREKFKSKGNFKPCQICKTIY